MTSISNVAGNYYKNTDNIVNNNILNKGNNTYMPSMMYDNSDNKYRQDMIQDKSINTKEIIMNNKSFISKLFPLFIIIVIVSILYLIYYVYHTILKKYITNDNKKVNTDLKKNKKSERKSSKTKEKNPLNRIFDINKIAKEDGYCYIGYDKGRRHCVEINKDDVCLSGVTYKNEKLCIDPELRL